MNLTGPHDYMSNQGPGSIALLMFHNLNARALGGVSGHAGLFGTARGVTEMTRKILRSLQSNDAFFDSPTLSLFCSPAGFDPASSRGLCFDSSSTVKNVKYN